MIGKLRWMGAVLALVLVLLLLVFPVGVYAQGVPGQGNSPPGQVQDQGQGDGKENDAAAAVNAVAQAVAQGNAQADQPRLINIRAERLIGIPIINRAGKQIGTVGDVLVNITGHRQSGNPERPASGGQIAGARADYILAQAGGLLGMGGKSVPVPLTALRLHVVDGERLGFDDNLVYFPGTEPGDDGLQAREDFFKQNALVLVSDQEDLDNVPQFERDELHDLANPAWDRSLRAYWQGLGTTWPETNLANGTAYRVNSVRNLGRFSLRELGGDGIGAIEDVLLTLAVANPSQVPLPPAATDPADADNGDPSGTDDANNGDRANVASRALAASLPIVDTRVDYALVSHGGWWGLGAKTTPLPLGMMIMDRNYDQRSMYVEADKDLLGDAPAMDSKQVNELNDDNYFNRVRTYWQQEGFGPFER